MESKKAYQLKAGILERKYGEIAEEFKQYKDDRLLVANMMEQLLEACEAMEGIENAFVCVAFNKKFKEQEATMDRIVTRFTGRVYKDFKWRTPEEVEALKKEEEPKTVSHRDFWTALSELRDRFRSHNVSICDHTDETGIIDLRVSWASIGSTEPDEARDFAEWVQIASDAVEHFKYAGYRIVYGEEKK